MAATIDHTPTPDPTQRRVIELATKAERQHDQQGGPSLMIIRSLCRALAELPERTFNRVVWSALFDETDPPRYDTYYIGASRAQQAKQLVADLERTSRFEALGAALRRALGDSSEPVVGAASDFHRPQPQRCVTGPVA